VVARGDVVYVVADPYGHAQLAQGAEAQSALVALDRTTQHRRARRRVPITSPTVQPLIQAKRLPGSGFKPFLYSPRWRTASLRPAYARCAVRPRGAGLEQAWRPENSGPAIRRAQRLRDGAGALTQRRFSIRLLRELATGYAIDYMAASASIRAACRKNLTLALGTLQATPLEIANRLCGIRERGYRVQPYFIDRIETRPGKSSGTPRRASSATNANTPRA